MPHMDNADFINAIVANPQDDVLRLAYADWLEKRNETLDSERATFLRLQCELHGKPKEGVSYRTLYQRCLDIEYKLDDDAWLVWVHDDLAIPPGLSEKGRRAAMTILKVLAKEKFAFTGGCRLFWTPSESKQRGWELSEECVVLVVVHDGPMHTFFTPDSPDQWRRHDKMDKALRKQGMFHEPYDNARSNIVDEENY